MDSLFNAALLSWSLDPAVWIALLASFLIYSRGWLAGRRLVHGERDVFRISCFTAGLLATGLALESPLNSFDSFFLSAHMLQHLLLMIVAPPLLLLGQPLLPMLRGLPRNFVKQGLGPFLTWPALRRFSRFATALPAAFLLSALSTILWHTPAFYELALASPGWHGAQHASFFWTGILFWWPVIPQSPEKPRWPQWAFIPYLLFADLINTALSAFFVFSGKAIYPSYETVRIAGFSPTDDQALAGALMWVPGSLIYLVPAFVLASRLLNTRPRTPERWHVQPRVLAKPGQKQSLLTRALKAENLPAMRRTAQWLMLAIAAAVVTDGLAGPQIAPLNLAGVLPWIHWRALTLVALLTLGNLFCMSCPFTLVRDIGRRVLPANWRWPQALRTKWISILLLLVYLWAYEALGLWNSPAATAWVIVSYFAAALLIDGLFRGASFCKYVCPIGQFHFVTSLVSPREVRIRDSAVCSSCQTYDCIRGNERTRGCELDLFQPRKASNLDCTFCMDCIKACPHGNVSVLPVLPALTVVADPYRSSLGRLSKRTDWAALVLLITFGAFVNAAGMVEPVMVLQHRWHARWGVHSLPLIVALFVFTGVALIPGLLVAVCGFLNALVQGQRRALDFARRFSFALAPLGSAMWAAHLLYHFVTGWDAQAPALARIAGRSADRITPFLPGWLTPMQILLLDAGLLLTLYVVWRIASPAIATLRTSLVIFAPWAAIALSLYATGIWILLQPMQMRGMMH